MRKYYDKDFKLSVIKLVVENNIPVTKVAREANISCSLLYRWIREYKEFGGAAFPGHGSILFSYE